MKNSEFKKHVVRLFGKADEWVVQRDICYRSPVDWSVDGVTFENSSADDAVYVWALHVPLMAPLDVMPLTWSERMAVDGRSLLRPDNADFDSAMKIALMKSKSHSLKQYYRDQSTDLYELEVCAYAQIIEDAVDRAAGELREILAVQVEEPWEEDILSRAREIQELLRQGRSAALSRLLDWRSESLSYLQIERASSITNE